MVLDNGCFETLHNRFRLRYTYENKSINQLTENVWHCEAVMYTLTLTNHDIRWEFSVNYAKNEIQNCYLLLCTIMPHPLPRIRVV